MKLAQGCDVDFQDLARRRHKQAITKDPRGGNLACNVEMASAKVVTVLAPQDKVACTIFCGLHDGQELSARERMDGRDNLTLNRPCRLPTGELQTLAQPTHGHPILVSVNLACHDESCNNENYESHGQSFSYR
jgi:hypothetical protein